MFHRKKDKLTKLLLSDLIWLILFCELVIFFTSIAASLQLAALNRIVKASWDGVVSRTIFGSLTLTSNLVLRIKVS